MRECEHQRRPHTGHWPWTGWRRCRPSGSHVHLMPHCYWQCADAAPASEQPVAGPGHSDDGSHSRRVAAEDARGGVSVGL